ncbi:MAG TPA: PHP domain-containing protein [Gemmatimonadaceae bacterium]|nr:PHP domain-containing protein [Gemmatimonadaceae bacterium]
MTTGAGAGAVPRFVDLHMHSTASDGSRAPEDVVAAASAAGLSAIALTDHDTLAGVPAARAVGDRLGVRVIAGVELSAHLGDREHHVLGLHVDRVDALEAALATFRATRRVRAEQIVAKLNGLGVPVALDAVLAEAAGAAIGRPHVARALIAGGWARDQREAFDRYLGSGRPAYVPKHRLPLPEAIAMVHAAAGLAVIAHPGAQGTRDFLEPLAAMGLDGVEVRHPSHSAEDMARLGALTDFLKLVPSGGSDWHGAADGPRTIGNMSVPASFLERQDARRAERAARAHVA